MRWIWSELLHQGLHHLCTFKRVLRIDRVALNWVNLYIIRLIFHFFCKDWQIGQPKWFWCREIQMFEAFGLMGCLLWMGKRVYSFNCKEYIPCSRAEDFYYGTYRADKHGIVLLGALVLVLLYRWKHSDTWFPWWEIFISLVYARNQRDSISQFSPWVPGDENWKTSRCHPKRMEPVDTVGTCWLRSQCRWIGGQARPGNCWQISVVYDVYDRKTVKYGKKYVDL